MRSSTLLQLSPYILLEYIYGDATSTYAASSVKLSRLTNEYTGERTFLNGHASKNVTGNVLDNTGTNLSGANWVSLDRDVPVPYISQDAKMTFTDLTPILSSLNVVYDTVRFHIQSGYNFDNVEGLLLQSYVREAKTSKMANLTSSFVLKSTDRILFNATPFYMTDRVYDRYIDILIPSVKVANDDYYANPANKNSIGGQYSSDGNGFLINSNIYVKATEIDSISKKNGITYFKTNAAYTVTIRQDDIYNSVSAIVKEAADGDYFEFYPTNNGSFIEELIFDLNSQGGNYVVINQIDIIEQVGFEFVNTFSFTNMQSTGFDAPYTFRPILKYADVSPSFSIEYTARIYNTENAFQIIKKAATTSYNPKKYGKNMERIALSNVTSPLKVYNKVYSGQKIEYAASSTTQFNTIYVPVYYDSKNLFVGSKNVLAEGANPLSPNFNANDVFFGQGYARIYLGNFDQYFKFSIHQLVSKTNSLDDVDLSKLDVSIAFEDIYGKLFTIPALPSTTENDKYHGEVVFKIDANVKTRIGLTTGSTKSFYILSTTNTSENIKLYSGTVQTDDNMTNEASRITSIGSQAITLKDLATINSTATTQTIDTNLNIATSSNSILSQINQMNVATVQTSSNTQVINPVIPGFTTDDNAQSMMAISPITTT